MHLKYYLHNLPESLIPWILILIFNDNDNTPLLFIFISSIHVLLYPYSKLTISRYIKENTKLKRTTVLMQVICIVLFINGNPSRIAKFHILHSKEKLNP